MKFKELPEMGTGNKNFLKLKDKESVTGVFRGDIQESWVVWENGKKKQVEEGTIGASLRFNVNFVTKEGSTYVPKIWEFGVTVYRQLADLNEEYDLEETVVKITRNGTDTDTTYSILPLPAKNQMSKEAKDFVSKLELLPLAGAKQNGEFHMQTDTSESIPF